jgi:uncharacterized membrane protein YidH (DUF202 family)
VKRLVRLPHPTRVADRGLQGERTFLAWQRTGLSFAAVGATLLHFGGTAERCASGVIGLFGVAAGGLLIAAAIPRYRHFAPAARGEHPAALPLAVFLTALTGAVLAIGALLLVLDTTPLE